MPLNPIIGLCGPPGAGKSTAADIIRTIYPLYSVRRFSDALCASVGTIIGETAAFVATDAGRSKDLSETSWPGALLRGRLTRALVLVVQSVRPGQLDRMCVALTGSACRESAHVRIGMTVGRLLHALDAEARAAFGDNVWVSATLGQWRAERMPPIIIADDACLAEATAVQMHGGRVLRVERPGMGTAEHADDITPFWTIHNVGLLSEFGDAVRATVDAMTLDSSPDWDNCWFDDVVAELVGERSDGERSDGERSDGERRDGERRDSERSDGERRDGERSDDSGGRFIFFDDAIGAFCDTRAESN